MKFLTVAAALLASTALAVPTRPSTTGACAPNGGSSSSSSSSNGGSSSTGSNTNTGPGSSSTGGNTSSGPGSSSTGSNTSSGPGSSSTGVNTSSGPGSSSTGGNSSTGPGSTNSGSSTGPATTGTGSTTGSNTSTGPATTGTGSSTGSNTSSGPATTTTGGPGGEFHCPSGLYSTPQCCSVDVLGVLGLDCANPSRAPTSGDDFKGLCAAVGKQAKCCVLPIAGQDVLCQDAIPGGPTSTGSGGNPTSSNTGGNPTSSNTGNPTTSSSTGNPTTSSNTGNPTTSSNTGNPTTSGPATTTTGGPGGEFHCPSGLYSNLQCCSTDVLGVADLDCANPAKAPTSADDFKAICAAAGKQAKCCVLPVAGQAVLCQDVPGGGNPTSSGPSSNPTSSNPGGNPTSSGPGGNPTSSNPGGNPTSSNPGGNPTSSGPGGNPTNPPGGFTCPSSGLYTNPQCCSVDVLGVADLDCETPSSKSGNTFTCPAGKKATCCVLPVAGQGVLCQGATPVGNPTSSNPGGNPTSSGPGSNPTSSGPGGNPTSSGPGGNPTSSNPGGNPTTSGPGSNPTNPPGGYKCPASGLYTNPQCCSVDVLGVADLDCETASGSASSFTCPANKKPKCCVLPVAGQSLLCQDATPVGNPTSSAPGGNPTSSNPGGNPTSSGPGGNPTSSGPSSNPTSSTGGNPTSSNPGGNPTSSAPTGNPTNPPSGYKCPASGLYTNPQCCSVDVLGVADLDCETASGSASSFTCPANKKPKCCVLPVAGQSLLCQDATPVGNPTSSAPGGNPTSSQPGSNPTSSAPGSNPTSSAPGSNPTSSQPGSNPTSTQPPPTSSSQPPTPVKYKCPTGLYANPQCCSVDVLGVADLDCETGKGSKNSFTCPTAKQGRCCVLPILGQGVLCTAALKV